MKWRASLIAWANDAGVKVYDAANDQRITFIERPRRSPHPEILLPHLVWQVRRRLIYRAFYLLPTEQFSLQLPRMNRFLTMCKKILCEFHSLRQTLSLHTLSRCICNCNKLFVYLNKLQRILNFFLGLKYFQFTLSTKAAVSMLSPEVTYCLLSVIRMILSW